MRAIEQFRLLGLLLALTTLAACSGSIPFVFTGADNTIGIGDDGNGDGTPDDVIIDGTPIPIIPPTDTDPGCIDFNSDGSCGSDEPPIENPGDPIPIPTPIGCDDPDNDGICGTKDLIPDAAILLVVISSNESDPESGVSSAQGSLSFDNGAGSSVLFSPSRFNNTPQTFCYLLNASDTDTNVFAGMDLKGSPGDKLTLEIYSGDDGAALLAACASDPASAGTLICSGSTVRAGGSSTPVSFECAL